MNGTSQEKNVKSEKSNEDKKEAPFMTDSDKSDFSIKKTKIKSKDKSPIPKNKPGFCSKCGAYVGAFPKCHWCYEPMPHAPELKLGRILALIMTIAGLIMIGMYASIEPAPNVRIADLGPTYSNANLIIKGNITNIDYYEPDDGSWKSLRFTVDDGSGSIEVKAYTETIDKMIFSGNTPALGETCSVRGSFYIRGDEKYILLGNNEYFITSREINHFLNASTLASLYSSKPQQYRGDWAQLNGTITYIGNDGVYFDLDNSVRIYFPEYVRVFSINSTFTFIEGDRVSIEGIIHDYNGKPELHLARAEDISFISHGGQIV
jgi:DNA/RNA endonuclease YhcR with UshA esterase domain